MMSIDGILSSVCERERERENGRGASECERGSRLAKADEPNSFETYRC